MKFKNFSLPVVMALVVSLSLLSTTSCKKVKGCNDKLAMNYDPDADENDGSCNYKLDKFIGTYSMNEDCQSGSYSYEITITEAGGENAIIIGNFAELFLEVKATVTGNNISINDTKDGYHFLGTGHIDNDTITFEYTATKNSNSDTCSAEGQRK